MNTNDKISIWNKSIGTKVGGIYIPGVLGFVKDINVDKQPYSKALLLKTYGYDIEVNVRIFIPNFDSDIKIGTILKYTNKYGKSINAEVKAIPWDKNHMEVVCLEVIL